jgi:transposase
VLKGLINTGKIAAYKQRHARILLLADEGSEGPKMTDDEVAKAVGCGSATVERVRKRLVTQGLEAALQRPKIDRSGQRLLDGDAEAHLIAVACSAPPEGHNRWTLRLLAEKMVILEVVEHCSKDTVHRTLKKTNLSPG